MKKASLVELAMNQFTNNLYDKVSCRQMLNRSLVWKPCRLKCCWLILGLPLAIALGLTTVALRRDEPPRSSRRATEELSIASSKDIKKPFRYIIDREIYALDFDPRYIRINLLEGWDREQDAYEDTSALAYISGPTYEQHTNDSNQYVAVPLAELKLEQQIWRGNSSTVSRETAFIGVRHDGSAEFGYGELTQERVERYNTFIGGLHSIFNELESPSPSYKNMHNYSISQKVGYHLPQIRIVFGLLPNGRIEILMSQDKLTLKQTHILAKRRSYLAAYMPDHTSKSRFIIPEVKRFTKENNSWTNRRLSNFARVPYMLRLSERRVSLPGKAHANFILHPSVSRSYRELANHIILAATNLGNQVLIRLNKTIEHSLGLIVYNVWLSNKSRPGVMNSSKEVSSPTTVETHNQLLTIKPSTTTSTVMLSRQAIPITIDANNQPKKHTAVADLGNLWALSPDPLPPVSLHGRERPSADLDSQLLQSSLVPGLSKSSDAFDITLSVPPPPLPPPTL